MNRRSFIKGLVGAAAAGFAVPDLILPPEPEKRFWALDQTMMGTERYWESGWVDSRYEPPVATTIRVLNPERFTSSTDRIIMIDNEVVWVDEINPDGTFTIQRGIQIFVQS